MRRNRKHYQRGPNTSEFLLESALEQNKVDFTRRGYPDYTIIKNGEIIGFIEVKPHENKQLRRNQEIFKRFCEKNKIPFLTWIPGEPLPQWVVKSDFDIDKALDRLTLERLSEDIL